MNMTPSSLQPPSMLDRHSITPPSIPISNLSPLGLGTPLPTMAPAFNPHQVVPPRVVSPRTPTASPPTMMSNTLFNKPSLFKSPQVSIIFISCSNILRDVNNFSLSSHQILHLIVLAVMIYVIVKAILLIKFWRRYSNPHSTGTI